MRECLQNDQGEGEGKEVCKIIVGKIIKGEWDREERAAKGLKVVLDKGSNYFAKHSPEPISMSV